ncbi:MAG TPA: PEP-CTERM sorting domain-containing protein [Phycisphaerae bacterium]|nr:PEP-CTERM sorting domain-containing protein [Phycisphaerae bacterium]
MTRFHAYSAMVVAAAVCLGLATVQADASIMLRDANSIAQFDLASARGLHSWTVDGNEYMYQQWFWYRLGANGPESSIDTLTLDGTPVLTDMNHDPDNYVDTLYARYVGEGFRVELWFILAGGAVGSGVSDLGEIIRITNTGSQNLDFHFFQYADFNLSDNNDTLEITGGNDTIAGNTAHQTAPDVMVAETVVTPRPSRHQVGLDGEILALLDNAGPTVLDNDRGPVTGDAAWGFQWDRVIRPGGTVLISKDKNITPEPATLALMGGGAIVALVARRRRS